MIQKFIFLKKFFVLKIIFHFLSNQMLPNCLRSWGPQSREEAAKREGGGGVV